MLAPDFGPQSAARWLAAKFGIEMRVDDLRGEPDPVRTKVIERILAKYNDKEAEYPVLAGFYKFAVGSGSQSRIDRDALLEWAARRFETPLNPDDFKSKQRDEIRTILVEHSRGHQRQADAQVAALHRQVDELARAGQIPLSSGNGAAESLADWFQKNIHHELNIDSISQLDKKRLSQKLESIVEDRYHPEMRRMERYVLLEIVDAAWKEHLLAMDYLLAACRQRGYGQLDPKVEYKREGMRMFESLWQSISERTTDVIFRIEQLNENFVNTTWTETSATHEAAPQASAAQMADRDIEYPQGGERKVETIRNRGQRQGRNDPCACGSGKKFKHCCMNKQQA
jgi:preprotein translocase subunit SecA